MEKLFSNLVTKSTGRVEILRINYISHFSWRLFYIKLERIQPKGHNINLYVKFHISLLIRNIESRLKNIYLIFNALSKCKKRKKERKNREKERNKEGKKEKNKGRE